jgi:hypothetical protein
MAETTTKNLESIFEQVEAPPLEIVRAVLTFESALLLELEKISTSLSNPHFHPAAKELITQRFEELRSLFTKPRARDEQEDVGHKIVLDKVRDLEEICVGISQLMDSAGAARLSTFTALYQQHQQGESALETPPDDTETENIAMLTKLRTMLVSDDEAFVSNPGLALKVANGLETIDKLDEWIADLENYIKLITHDDSDSNFPVLRLKEITQRGVVIKSIMTRMVALIHEGDHTNVIFKASSAESSEGIDYEEMMETISKIDLEQNDIAELFPAKFTRSLKAYCSSIRGDLIERLREIHKTISA